MADAIVETLELFSKDKLGTFDITTDREIPHYDDPEKEALNLQINLWRNIQLYPSPRPTFLILEAQKETRGESKHLAVLGYYELFDGVRIDVKFEGEYGDPSEDKIRGDWLKPENCFRSFDFEARVQNADDRQIGLFSQIEPFSEDNTFYNGVLHRSRQKDRFKFMPPSLGGELHNIVEVGRIAQMYEYLHDPHALQALALHRQKFINSLLPFGETLTNININLKEGFVWGGGEPRSLPYAQLSATREGTAGIVLRDRLPREPYSITFRYNTELAKKEAILNAGARGGQLIALINLSYQAWIEHIELTGDVGEVANTVDFIMRSLMFIRHNQHDSVDNMYAGMFDDSLKAAREEMRQANPDYQPLVPTFEEQNRHIESSSFGYHEEERLEFVSLEAFYIFEGMLNVLRRNPQIGIDGLLSDFDVQARMEKSPQLKRRILIYSDCYKKDPKEALSLFQSLDPAYARAEQLYKKEEERLFHSDQ